MATLTCNPQPTINLDACSLTAEERQIAERIVNKGKLRASKPKVEYISIGLNSYGRECFEPEQVSGEAAYVWRMVAFTISPIAKHWCMPCTADFDVPGKYGEAKRARIKELDVLANKIIACVPKSQHYGTIRWGRAFGLIG